MTRLVIHAGTHATGWKATQRQLVSWREPLTALGVHLHPADDPERWLSDGLALATGVSPSAIVDAAERAVRLGADILIVSSERLEDSLRDPDRLANLVSFAQGLGLPLTVLVVMRDQLGYLNQRYCERVAHLQTARGFPTFVAEPSPPGRFDYATAFTLPMATPEIDFVGVRYVEMQPGVEARSLLTAVGIAAKDAAALPAGPSMEALPGPILVAAKRLLYKRLWRLGLVTRLPRPRLARAARSLAAHARARSWDSAPFWGWDVRGRAEALDRYGPGNDVLAEALWGEPWGDVYEDGVFVDVDLPACEPERVVDVLGAVDVIVRGMPAPKTAVAPE